jgi:hypothetical protein
MLAEQVLKSIWEYGGAALPDTTHLRFSADQTSLPSTYQVGALASAAIAAQALAAQQIWLQRGGAAQHIHIDHRHALAMCRSERYLQINGEAPADLWSPIAGYYQAGDGRWIQLHTNFPHHRDGVLRILDCDNERAAVAAAIRNWSAAELESCLAEQAMCAAMIRTPAEWQAHPQAQAVAALPLFEIRKIGEAPVRPFLPFRDQRPLDGVKVLDLSRVIAAPVAGRTLAQHGAEVLAVSAAHLPNILPLVMDTGRGKRSAQIDLRSSVGNAQMHALMADADVFLQAYRPGALAGFGFAPEALCEQYPGLICVSLSAYGHAGPWAQRRGFDSLVQSASGIAFEEGMAAGLSSPGKLPCQALDHATGYLMAMATMMALQRRAQEGGSWEVRVSLAQTGHFLQSLGRRALHEQSAELTPQEIAAFRQTTESGFGRMEAIAPVEAMSLTPPYFAQAAVAPGTHAASWS